MASFDPHPSNTLDWRFIKLASPLVDPATGSVTDTFVRWDDNVLHIYYYPVGSPGGGAAMRAAMQALYTDGLTDQQALWIAEIAERTVSQVTPDSWLTPRIAARLARLAETDPTGWARLVTDREHARRQAATVFADQPHWRPLVEHFTEEQVNAAASRMTPLPVTPKAARKALHQADKALRTLVTTGVPREVLRRDRGQLRLARAHWRETNGDQLAELIGLRARDLQADARRMGLAIDHDDRLVTLAARLVLWGGISRVHPAMDNLPLADVGDRIRAVLNRAFIAGYLHPELLPEKTTLTGLLDRYEHLHRRLRNELATAQAASMDSDLTDDPTELDEPGTAG